MPDRYHIHTAATPGRFRRIGQVRQCRLARGLLPLQQLRQAALPLRRLPARVGLQPRPVRRRARPWTNAKPASPACRAAPRGCWTSRSTPSFWNMGDEYWKPDILLTTWNQADTGRIPVSGRGLSRPVSRARFRFDLDGHVGNRPPHPRRHSRARVHLDQRGYRSQAAAPEVHARRQDADAALAADRDSASGDPRHAGLAGAGRAPGRGAHRGGEGTEDAGRGPRRRCRSGAAQAIAVSSRPCWPRKTSPTARTSSKA